MSDHLNSPSSSESVSPHLAKAEFYVCPKCRDPLRVVFEKMHFRGRWFSGLHCGRCNGLWDNPEDSMVAYVASLTEPSPITFDEFVEFGRQNGGNIVAGMPWSFNYMGYPVSHENDDLYLITTPTATLRFNRGQTLTIDGGEIYVR